MEIKPENRGWIEIICGGMFSGKTEELIRRLKRAIIAGQKVIIFKPEIDNRYSEEDIVTHDGQKIEARTVKISKDIIASSSANLEASLGAEVIGIDEVQFFDHDITEICKTLANAGKRVIVAGLDMDFRGEPFGPTPQIMAIAEKVTKIRAICVKCGNEASFSQLVAKRELKNNILVAGKEVFEARCRRCFDPPKK